MPIYSEDNHDFMGTATYRGDVRKPYSAVALGGRERLFPCRRAAVEWLTRRYDQTH